MRFSIPGYAEAIGALQAGASSSSGKLFNSSITYAPAQPIQSTPYPIRVYVWPQVPSPEGTPVKPGYVDLPLGSSVYVQQGDALASVILPDQSQLRMVKHLILGIGSPDNHNLFCQLNGLAPALVKPVQLFAPCGKKETLHVDG